MNFNANKISISELFEARNLESYKRIQWIELWNKDNRKKPKLILTLYTDRNGHEIDKNEKDDKTVLSIIKELRKSRWNNPDRFLKRW